MAAGHRRRTGCRVALAACAALLTSCAPATVERPNLILLVVDTLRADHLGAYGYPGPISPALDEFAAESILFERCSTQAPWTKPAMASLFTSLYVQVHGLTSSDHEVATGVLPAEAVTLAESLRGADYRTAGFVANSWLLGRYGFGQGFDLYHDADATLTTPATRLTHAAGTWLDGLDRERPFFLYLHFMDVHAPYDGPREDFDELRPHVESRPDALSEHEVPYNRWNNIEIRPPWADEAMRHEVGYWRARYASGVREFDRRIGGFLDYLRESGYLRTSYVILTSDHGEELFEHGDWSHGQNLYDHQLRIPLLVRAPRAAGAGRRVRSPVELVDLMPTLLRLAGAPVPESTQGRDLSGVLLGDEEPGLRLTYATAAQRQPDLYSVTSGRFKLVMDLSSRRSDLFDLVADPGERANVAAREWGSKRRLEQELARHVAVTLENGPLRSQTAPVPPEVRERLRALGYLN